MAKASCSVVRPYPDRPNEGQMVFNCEFSPMTFAGLETGRPTEDELLIARAVERAIRKSRAVDTESLCILAGEMAPPLLFVDAW
jgi:exosome complex component RRP45